MEIKVNIDTSALKLKVEREQKRLAYNTAQALNDTTKDVQTAMRIELDRDFRLRKAGFMYRLIKIFAFASAKKGTPFTEIGIDKKDRVILGAFEDGAQRGPAVGKNVAVPLTGTDARPTFGDPVQTPFTFKRMKLTKGTSGGKQGNWLFGKGGEQGTYAVPGVGVFERLSKAVEHAGKMVTGKLIYAFKKPMKLDARLKFKATAARVFAEKFQKNFEKAYRKGGE